MAMSEKSKWDGGFEAARRIADEILEDYLGSSNVNDGLAERIAEALVVAFDNGVLAEHNECSFTKVLREHGIGIATLDEMQERMIAAAKGELKLHPDEPKLWFPSIEAMVEALKRPYNVGPR